jgi:hypothetical protein
MLVTKSNFIYAITSHLPVWLVYTYLMLNAREIYVLWLMCKYREATQQEMYSTNVNGSTSQQNAIISREGRRIKKLTQDLEW